MRKTSLMFTLLLLVALVYGQARQITGQVKDASGNPIPFASVKIKGTNTGIAADQNGNFTISAEKGNVLEITAASYERFEVTVADQDIISVTLVSQDNLSEVVVTALGVRRAKNTLPYAAQQIKGDEVNNIRTANVGAALSGKVSGVEIRQGNGIGASTNIVIRGTKSLTNTNQALFVVDGVPINNATGNSANQMTGRGGVDYGNAAADINPDDIENINILKGAAASALYGSRAANGVIMITTKKSRRGLGVTINSGVSFGAIDKETFAKYQNQYGAGYSAAYGSPDENPGFFYFDVDGDGQDDLVVPTSEDASYGDKFDPNLMVYHWDAFDPTSPFYKTKKPWVAAQNTPETFYEKPVSNNNSIMLDGATDKGNFKLGYTRSQEKGILPNSEVIKNIVNFGAGYEIAKGLVASTNINFSKVEGTGRYGTGYSGKNVNQNFRQWYQTNVDNEEQKEAYFRTRKNITWNWQDPSTAAGLRPIYTDNFYFMRYESFNNDERTRIFGNVALNYQATEWLSFLGRISMDTYDELREDRTGVGSVDVPGYSRANRHFQETNYDLMANFNKDLNDDFNLQALLGTNMRRSRFESIDASTNGGLVVPGLYSISNSLNPINSPTETYNPIAVDGYFGGITLGYRNFLTLDGTYRYDRSSTLPVENNEYGYFSVSGSWLFSENLKNISWLSYGKLRANYAEVGNDAPWGAVADIYSKPNPFGNTILFTLPSAKNNNELLPERTNSKEVGLEMAFFGSRLGFDVSYYVTNTINQLIPVAVSIASGYSSKWQNAGDVQNKGIELSLYGTPVKTRDFTWTTNINWTRNRNEVTALFGESRNLQIASFQGGVSINATLNEPYGAIMGRTWVFHENGGRIVRSNGRYALSTSTNNVIGNMNPDWIGGIYNTFRYKDLSLGFLIDVRHGGDLFSLDLYYGMATGLYPETVQLNDLGNPSRNSLEDGGGIIVPGVTDDGKENTLRVPNDFGTYGYAYNPAAAFIYDASYVKLREMNLTYNLPTPLLNKLAPFKGISFSIIGRNLWIIHKNLPYADPEENLSSGNAQGYQSGAYPTTRQIGLNLKLKF